jgi:hypothetical protein
LANSCWASKQEAAGQVSRKLPCDGLTFCKFQRGKSVTVLSAYDLSSCNSPRYFSITCLCVQSEVWRSSSVHFSESISMLMLSAWMFLWNSYLFSCVHPIMPVLWHQKLSSLSPKEIQIVIY